MFIWGIVNLLYHVSSRASEAEKEPGSSNNMNGKPNKASKRKNVQVGMRASQLHTSSIEKKISGSLNEQHVTHMPVNRGRDPLHRRYFFNFCWSRKITICDTTIKV